jgi:type IV fimbrial biogenesis protein FimT
MRYLRAHFALQAPWRANKTRASTPGRRQGNKGAAGHHPVDAIQLGYTPYGGSMSTMRTHRRATAGFTLVEMMVVIVIMAILVVFALPSYRNLVSDSRMQGEINDLHTDMELARSAAIKQGLPVTICESPAPTASAPGCGTGGEWNTGWVAFTDTANNQTYSAASGDQLLRAHAALEGTDTLVSAAGVPSITFNRMGGTTAPAHASTTGVFTLRDPTDSPGLQRCVIVSETGNTTVDAPQTQNEANCI